MDFVPDGLLAYLQGTDILAAAIVGNLVVSSFVVSLVPVVICSSLDLVDHISASSVLRPPVDLHIAVPNIMAPTDHHNWATTHSWWHYWPSVEPHCTTWGAQRAQRAHSH